MTYAGSMLLNLQETGHSTLLYPRDIFTDTFYLRDPIEVVQRINNTRDEFGCKEGSTKFGLAMQDDLQWPLSGALSQVEDFLQTFNTIRHLFQNDNEKYELVHAVCYVVTPMLNIVIEDVALTSKHCGLCFTSQELTLLNRLASHCTTDNYFGANSSIDIETSLQHDTWKGRKRLGILFGIFINTMIMYNMGVSRLMGYGVEMSYNELHAYIVDMVNRCDTYCTKETVISNNLMEIHISDD